MTAAISFEEFKQVELKYRNKIIELQKQLDYEKLRGDEYQSKFKQSLTSISSNQENADRQILQKLVVRQQEVQKLRQQLLNARKQTQQLSANQNNGNSQFNQDLLKQNQELRNIVEELKNAAIEAIMQKDKQIEQLNNKFYEIDQSSELERAQQQIQRLQKQLTDTAEELKQQIGILNEKLGNQRSNFSQKLQLLHKSMSHEETMKEQLIEKTQHLQGNLESMEKVIEKYQLKIAQLEINHSSNLIELNKKLHESQIKIEDLSDELKGKDKLQREFQKSIERFNRQLGLQKKQIQSLNDEKEELDRKLKIKNRKANLKANTNTSNIFSSFEGFSQKADMFASFAGKRPDVRDTFAIGQPSDLSEIKEIQIEEIQNWNDYLDRQNMSVDARGQLQEVEQSKQQTPKTTDPSALQKQITQSNKSISGNDKKTKDLQEKLKKYLEQISTLNSTIAEMTKQIQKQRESKQELKGKILKSENTLKVERQSMQHHIYKLQNALLIEKLQNAQNIETNKQIREQQKAMYQEQIKKLKSEKETPKKKKGFFS